VVHPHSSSSAEWFFSFLKLICSSLRNKLSQDTIRSLMHVKRHVGHLWHWSNFVSVKTLNFHIFCMRLNVVNCKLKTDFFLSKYNSVFGYHSNDPSSFSLKTSVKAWQNEKLFWVACGNVTQPHLLNQGQFCLRVKCLKGCLVMEIKSLSVSRILPPTLTVCLHHVVMLSCIM
jgi:hypothetical protein